MTDVTVEALQQAEPAEPHAEQGPHAEQATVPVTAALPRGLTAPAATPSSDPTPVANIAPGARAAESRSLYRQGAHALRVGDLDYAENLFRDALELNRRLAPAAAGIARVRLKQGNLDTAWHWAERAVRLRPKRSDYHVLQGDIWLAQGDHASANGAFRQALAIDPNNMDARGRL